MSFLLIMRIAAPGGPRRQSAHAVVPPPPRRVWTAKSRLTALAAGSTDDCNSLSKDHLKEACRERKLFVSGTKAQLTQRLQDAQAAKVRIPSAAREQST